jgi:galactose mutarotase-like enzyme
MTLTIGTERLSARIHERGAEPCSLRDAAGEEYLWQAGPEWPRHAPILFPIVGQLAGDTLRHGGATYRMTQHGFARDMDFAVVESRASACRLMLQSGPATLAAFPFPFRLEAEYAIQDATLTATWTVANTGEGPLPFSIGAHPAFRWPLPGATTKPGHRIEFEQEETGPAYRLRDGLLDPAPAAWPVRGRTLGLREELFREGAIILTRTASRRLRFVAPEGAAVEVAWQGFSALGLWMRPGAAFLCIEPWAGHADPVGFEGEVFAKPGIEVLPPGERRQFLYRITPGG